MSEQGNEPIPEVPEKKEDLEDKTSTSMVSLKGVSEVESEENIKAKELALAEYEAFQSIRRVMYISLGMLIAIIFIFDAFFISLNRNSLKNDVLSAEDEKFSLVSKLVKASVDDGNIPIIEKNFSDWIKNDHSIFRLELRTEDNRILASAGDPNFEGGDKLYFIEELKDKNGQNLFLGIYTDKNRLLGKFRQVTPLVIFLMIVFTSIVVTGFLYIFKRFALYPLRSTIIERNKAEEQLKKNQLVYFSLVEKAPEMIVRYDLQHRIIFANQSFSKFVNKPIEDITYKNIWGFFSREVKNAYVSTLKPATPENPERNFTSMIVKPDSTPVWIQWTERAFFDDQKRLLYYQMVGVDISSTRQSQESLLLDEKRFADALNSSSEFLWEVDIENKYTFVTSKLCNILGYSQAEIIGKSMSQFLDSQEVERLNAIFEKLVAKKLSFSSLELIHRKKDGSITYLSFSGTPILDEAGNILGYRGIGRNITESMAINLQLKQAKEISETRSKAKSEFLESISRELRTPLNSVVGYSRFIIDSKPGAEVEDYAQNIAAESEVILDLVNRIINFSELESNKIPVKSDIVDIYQMTEQMIQRFIPGAVSKGLKFTFNITPDVSRYIITDSTRVRQLLFNLISNAIKFTDHGQVNVSIRVLKASENKENKDYLEIKVRDTGIGIADEDLKKLFVPNVNLDSDLARVYSGGGVGLATVKLAINVLGGRIEVKSTKSEGSEFSAIIPLILPEKGAYQDEESLIPGVQDLKGKKVLIATERPEEFGYVKLLLDHWGIETIFSQHPREWKTLKEGQPHADVVLVDKELHEGVDPDSINKESSKKSNKPPYIFLVEPKLTKAGALMTEKSSYKLSLPILSHSLLLKLLDVLGIEQKYEHQEAPEKSLSAEELEAKGIIEQLKVLIVEDNGINRKVMKLMLNHLGVKPDEAENGVQALEMMRKKDYQFVLMDLQMPEMDGYQATIRIRNGEVGENNRNVVIVALTSNVLPVDQERCKDVGMNDYLDKPVKAKVLEKMIRSLFVPENIA